MGEPYNCKNEDPDPEKGESTSKEDPARPSIGNLFSKAGEGVTNAITKAGEGIHNTGTTWKDSAKSAGANLKDSAKSAGAMVGLVSADNLNKTPQKLKKNPNRAKHEKKFKKSFKPSPHEEPKDTNVVGNITKLLPANTFLMFQTLAPLSTNDGNCHSTEKFMTGVMLMILCSTCMLVCFTDTIQFNGKVYHGLVTRSGLWNPSFKGDPSLANLRRYELELAQFYEDRRRYKADKRHARKEGLAIPPRPVEPLKPMSPHIMGSTYSSGNPQYELNLTDFLHAVLSAMAFATLTMLTSPVSTCFYPNISSTVTKTLPLLVGFVISAIFAFSPPARNGIAHPLSPKVASQMDFYKPPDAKGVVHGPSLPPKPPGKGDPHAAGEPKLDHGGNDGEGGSVTKFLGMAGKLFSSGEHVEQGKSDSPSQHNPLVDGVKSLASGLFSKYGDDMKQGAANMMHNLESDAQKEATNLLLKAAPSVAAELSKEIHVPLALQEATKSVSHEALVAGLVNAGAHPSLAMAAVQSAAQGAKDAALKQIHQELQAATSGSLAGLSKQSSMALTRGNSMLHSTVSLPSAQDALFHQAAQVLQRQASGFGVHAPGSEAAAMALATGEALMHAGYQLPGGRLEPQAAAMNAYSHGIGNLNLSSANALMNDATSFIQQGGKSVADLHAELARQQSAFSQGLNSQTQSLSSYPRSSAAQNIAALANSGSQTMNHIYDQVAQGTFGASLAAGVAREAGTLLQEGADHGMAGVQDEISRQKAAVAQSIAQPVSALSRDAAALAQQGSQDVSNAKAAVLKQKEALTQEITTEARALSTPATSVAQDVATLVKKAGSQPTVSAMNSQFVDSLARGMARGLNTQIRQEADHALADHGALLVQQFQQPAASVAVDVASLLQQGSQMHAQLARQASALSSPQAQNAAQQQAAAAAASMLQRSQAALGQNFQLPSMQPTAQQVVDTQMALHHLASQLSSPQPPPPANSSAAMPTFINTSAPPSWPDRASLIIEEVTDAAKAGKQNAERLQRAAAQLPRVTEEAIAHAAAMTPSASQVRTASAEVVASTSEAAGQAAPASMTRILRPDRPESTEIVDAISTEEITSESETEHNNRGDVRQGSGSFNFQEPAKRKL